MHVTLIVERESAGRKVLVNTPYTAGITCTSVAEIDVLINQLRAARSWLKRELAA